MNFLDHFTQNTPLQTQNLTSNDFTENIHTSIDIPLIYKTQEDIVALF